MPHRPLRRMSTVGALLVAPALLVATPASATPSTEPKRTAEQTSVRTVHVVGSATGLTAPSTRPAGITTFRVSTTDPAGIRLGLFRLHRGVRLDRYLAHLRTAIAGHGDEAVAAGRMVQREATLLGGVNAAPGQPATLNQVLRPGTYHLIDYQDVDVPGRELGAHALTVTDQVEHDVPGRPDAMVRMVETPAGPRFQAPRTLTSDASLLISNLGGQLDEAIFMPVRRGTTSADVQRFFETIDGGGVPSGSPFVGLPMGMPVLSPGHAAVVRPGLVPGEYALVTWVTDLENGAMRAAEGAHALVTVV